MADPRDRDNQGSLFSAMYHHAGGTRSKRVRRENLEIGLGFLGFFTLVSLIATVVAELSGKAAISEALVSAVFVSLTYLVYRKWRRAGGFG